MLNKSNTAQQVEFFPQALQDALNRFDETGKRLEEKYNALKLEADNLRKQLKEKDAEVARREKLSILGEMAAAIAHEVRNPLGAVKLFASLLRDDVEDKPEALKIVTQIETSVTHIDHIVENILLFAKDKPVLLTPINVHSVVQDQVSLLLSSGISQKAKINVELNGNPFARGNSDLLRQAFYNLVLNALQATKYSGEISISACDNSNGDLVLSIQDNGPGIPNDMIDKIFEPFVTTRCEGTGLGLAIVKKIIDHHQGTISVKSNGSTKFVITLPRKGA